MTLEKALDAYRNHFGEDYPLVITGTASEDEIIDEIERCIETNEKAGFYNRLESECENIVSRYIKENLPEEWMNYEQALAKEKEAFGKQCEILENAQSDAGKALENAFDFMETAFGEKTDQSGQYMVIFVTELTMSGYSSAYLADNT